MEQVGTQRRKGAIVVPLHPSTVPPLSLGRGSARPRASSPMCPPSVGWDQDRMDPIKPHAPSLQGCSLPALGAALHAGGSDSIGTGSVGAGVPLL